MPKYDTYPLAGALADDDLVLFHQDSSGVEKLVTGSELLAYVNANTPTVASFLASQYTNVTNTGNGGGTQVADALSGSIRGDLKIAANQPVAGSVFKYRLSGFLSTSGTGRSFAIKTTLQSQLVDKGSILNTIAPDGALTNEMFVYEGAATFTTVGAGGTIIGQASLTIGNTAWSGVGGRESITYPMGKLVTANVNTTIDMNIGALTTWVGGNALDSVTITNALFELI